jgi:hypothetical protein
MRVAGGSLWASEPNGRGLWCGGRQTAPCRAPYNAAMKLRTPTTLPVTPPPTRKDPKTDFTAEGAPPPGRVSTTGPITPLPVPQRKRLSLPRRP